MFANHNPRSFALLPYLLSGGLFIGSLALSPAEARAWCGDTEDCQGRSWGPEIHWEPMAALVGGFVLYPTSLAMLGVDAGYAVADDGWLPPGWAVTELSIGVLHAGLAGVHFFGDHIDQPVATALGTLSLGLSAWFIGHSVMSFVNYDPSEPDLESKPGSWQFGVAPLEQGAKVSFGMKL